LPGPTELPGTVRAPPARLDQNRLQFGVEFALELVLSEASRLPALLHVYGRGLTTTSTQKTAKSSRATRGQRPARQSGKLKRFAQHPRKARTLGADATAARPGAIVGIGSGTARDGRLLAAGPVPRGGPGRCCRSPSVLHAASHPPRVVVENQLFVGHCFIMSFGRVKIGPGPAHFCTARKTLCLAALTRRPSAALMSAMGAILKMPQDKGRRS